MALEATGDDRVLWRLLEHHALKTPEHPFLISDLGETSFARAWSDAAAIARGLIAAGVEPGDRVAMLTPPEEVFALTYLACGMIGAIWLGINTRYTEAEIRYLLEDCQPRILITRDSIGERDLRSLFVRLAADHPSVSGCYVVGEAGPHRLNNFDELRLHDDGLEGIRAARAAAVRPQDAVLIVYTSGSTGRPKGAVLSHGAIIDNIAVQDRHFGLTHEDRFLLHLSPNHVAGAIEMLIGGLYVGCTMVLLDQFDTLRLLFAIERFNVTALLQIPTLYVMMFNHPSIDQANLSSIRKLYWAGSAAPREMVEAMRRRFPGARLVTGYGMTEVCGFVTYTGPDDADEDLMDTVGAIDPSFELRIVDEGRQPVSHGSTGEVAIRGPMLMTGYWGKPDATSEAVDAEGWYYSGDLGIADGRGYVTLVGRKKDMYISGGFNVYPREIEIVLEAHEDVAMACVVAEPDPVFQEVGIAFLVPKLGHALEVNTLTAYCREWLANYKCPKRFVIRDHLPMLGIGKIDRMALRAELAGTP
ncbi:MAG: acyl--CoA ligase [Beijerinckiaceae bacterium]|nr:acyl--CoA ligase [Beijerinckiaceae bacterium]